MMDQTTAVVTLVWFHSMFVFMCICLCVFRAQETFLQWDQCRRLYNFMLAENMKKIILSHRWSNTTVID